MSKSADNRSNLAKGVDWATRISTACMTMVLPCVGGYYLDQWLGTLPVFMLPGLAIGMGLGIWQLIRIARVLSESIDEKTSGNIADPSNDDARDEREAENGGE